MKEHCEWKSRAELIRVQIPRISPRASFLLLLLLSPPSSREKREWRGCFHPLQLRQSYYLVIPHRFLLPWQHLLDPELADGLLNRGAFGQHTSGQVSELPALFCTGHLVSFFFLRAETLGLVVTGNRSYICNNKNA